MAEVIHFKSIVKAEEVRHVTVYCSALFYSRFECQVDNFSLSVNIDIDDLWEVHFGK